MTELAAWAHNTKPDIPCIGESASRACPHRHRRYGMSCGEWAELWQQAGGRCEICRVAGHETSHGYLVIDHDYRRGTGVRGLLCSTCNTRIAYRTNTANMEATARYLANPWHHRNAVIEAMEYSRETVRRIAQAGKDLTND